MHLLNLRVESLTSKNKNFPFVSYFTTLNPYLQFPMQLYVKTIDVFRRNCKKELSFCPTCSSFTTRCVNYM